MAWLEVNATEGAPVSGEIVCTPFLRAPPLYIIEKATQQGLLGYFLHAQPSCEALKDRAEVQGVIVCIGAG